MKKYIAYLLILVSAFSCTNYLQEKQVTNLTQAYYNTEDGLESLIKGLYVYLRVKYEWDSNGAKLIDCETDNQSTSGAFNALGMATVAGYGSNVSTIAANVANFIGGANSSYAPMGAYPEINNCNIALEQIDNVHPGKFATASFANERKAEVLFLRSYAYYLITNQMGAVPLLLKANRSDNGIYYYPKVGMDTIYRQIIGDLRWAFNQLPPTQSDRGRITKWACGHLLAKLYLNRAQGATFANSTDPYLKMLYKGTVSTDLDSCIYYATQVINGNQGNSGTYKGLATDYWTLFNPAVSETSPSPEVLLAAQFDVNTSLNGRFGDRYCNYMIGDYTNQTGVTRCMAYGRPFGTYKPTDWAYDNFTDKVNDSRYYKTFQYEYISNMPTLSSSTSYTWDAKAAAWWNANKPAGAASAVVGQKRILFGQRALTYVENSPNTALDSLTVMSQPYQLMARWVKSATTGKLYYRLWIDGTGIGLNTTHAAPYLSIKKFIDPQRGGSTSETNYNSEAGTRDIILMRLAETYLIRAEAYGRKGDYADALADINTVRYRAAYKKGESRPEICALWEPQAKSLSPAELTPPYTVPVDETAPMMATEANFTPGTPQAAAENYVPSATTEAQMFIQFIYNEKVREFLGEGLSWEDQHNAGILYERVIYHNQEASPLSNKWPVAANTYNGNGQDGNGKGQYKECYTFRVWPQAYLNLLTDPKGNPLSAAALAAYQNPGY